MSSDASPRAWADPNWSACHQPDWFALPPEEFHAKMSQVKEIGDNLGAIYWALGTGDMEAIRRVSETIQYNPECRVWRTFAVPGQPNEVSLVDHGKGTFGIAAMLHYVVSRHVNILVFPGGFVMEASFLVEPPSREKYNFNLSTSFYLDDQMRIERIHEYIDSRQTGALTDAAMSLNMDSTAVDQLKDRFKNRVGESAD